MKKIFVALLLCTAALSLSAQTVYNSSGRKVAKRPTSQSGFDIDKLVVGGDFRFTLGQQLSVGVAPMVGYKLLDQFVVGARLGYSYDRVKIDYSQLPVAATTNIFKYNTFSGGLWARYLLFESVYIHTALEYNFFQDYQYDNNAQLIKKGIQSPSVLVGIGFRQPVSDRVTFNTTILYDVLNDPNSYYYYFGSGGIDYRVGILVGF